MRTRFQKKNIEREMYEPIYLQPHQEDLIQCISKYKATYAYHDTGTGKTFAALACLCNQLENDSTGHGLIVATSATADEWKNIIKNQIIPHNNVDKRISVLSHRAFFDLVREKMWEVDQKIEKKTNDDGEKFVEVTKKFCRKVATITLPIWNRETNKYEDKVVSHGNNFFLVVDEVQQQFKNQPEVGLSPETRKKTDPYQILDVHESYPLENSYGWTLRFVSVFWCTHLLLLSATPFVDSYADLINPLECLKIVQTKSAGHRLKKYMEYTFRVIPYNYTVPRSEPKRVEIRCRIQSPGRFTQNPFGDALTVSKLDTDIMNFDMTNYAYLFHRMKRHTKHPCYPKVVEENLEAHIDRSFSLYRQKYEEMVKNNILTISRTGGKSHSDFYEAERLNQVCIFNHVMRENKRPEWTTPLLESDTKKSLPTQLASPTFRHKEKKKQATATAAAATTGGSRMPPCPIFTPMEPGTPNIVASPIFLKVIEKLQEKSRSVIFTQSLEVQYYYTYLLKQHLKVPYTICVLDDHQRSKKIQKFNTTDIRTEGIVLFISKSGSAGVDLKETNNIFLLDLPFSYMERQQIIGRGQRFQSHARLPESKSVVNVYTAFIIDPVLRFGNQLIHEIVEDKKQKEIRFVQALESACGIDIRDNQYDDKLVGNDYENRCVRHLAYLEQMRRRGADIIYRSKFYGILRR